MLNTEAQADAKALSYSQRINVQLINGMVLSLVIRHDRPDSTLGRRIFDDLNKLATKDWWQSRIISALQASNRCVVEISEKSADFGEISLVVGVNLHIDETTANSDVLEVLRSMAHTAMAGIRYREGASGPDFVLVPIGTEPSSKP